MISDLCFLKNSREMRRAESARPRGMRDAKYGRKILRPSCIPKGGACPPLLKSYSDFSEGKKTFLALLLGVVSIFSNLGSAWALEMTAGLVFNLMEERTDKIDSLQADLIMISGPVFSRVNLAIQSPDKFSMNFLDKSVQAIFDGEKFWIYVKDLNEVFTLDATSDSGWISNAIREWVNPKKIVTQITRKTLFTFFDVALLPEKQQDPASFPTLIRSVSGYSMRFTPVGGSMVKKFFGVGYYEMVFSKASFLPVMVSEFDSSGNLRGILHVLEYRLNQPIPEKTFEFVPLPGIKQVPLIEVIKQRLALQKDEILEKLGEFLDRTVEKVKFWKN